MHTSARTRRVVTAVAGGALALSTVLMTGAPASAAVKQFSDGTGDTWTYNDQGEPVNEAGHSEVDLTDVAINHGKRKLSVTATFDDLQKLGEGGGLSMSFTAPGKKYYDLSVYSAPGNWKGKAILWKYSETGASGKVRCDLTRKMDYDNDVVTISAPTSCLKKPDWIKASVYAFWSPTMETFFLDNPANDTEMMGLTRRISRG